MAGIITQVRNFGQETSFYSHIERNAILCLSFIKLNNLIGKNDVSCFRIQTPNEIRLPDSYECQFD